jgi:hypothetical protein
MHFSRRLIIVGAMALMFPIAASAQSHPQRKPDLGDAAEGSYSGDVISDSKGSSQSNVHLTVTRVGVNLVKVTSDYDRLPEITVPLTRAMGKILQTRGNSVFLLDPAKSPPSLDVTFDGEVSWSGMKD